jgi:hypothetical protein
MSKYGTGREERIESIRYAIGQTDFIAYLRGEIAKHQWNMVHRGSNLEDARGLCWYQDRLDAELGHV